MKRVVVTIVTLVKRIEVINALHRNNASHRNNRMIIMLNKIMLLIYHLILPLIRAKLL